MVIRKGTVSHVSGSLLESLPSTLKFVMSFVLIFVRLKGHGNDTDFSIFEIGSPEVSFITVTTFGILVLNFWR